ncbi:MAG TPA: NADP-dependent oxidoreductase [Candidatus Deferrimicrobiaceae bacterium]|nr:NADP-dependent oxidoreductase [Candidatus Deferrimicrobiaceae bacterium]
MRAIVIESFGGPEVLRAADRPSPEPSADEVLIEVAYAGVNPVDWKIREGMLAGMFPHEFPLIPGWDAAGTVKSMGKDVTGFRVGDRVYAYCRKPKVQFGAYAEFVTMNHAAVAPIPKNVGFAEAASIPLAGLTAWQSLFDAAKIQAGDRVLIHAGAGGVGSLAIQFAKTAGAKVYTTARGVNHDYVTSLGADVPIDYTKVSFVDVVRKMEPGGIDLVYDAVGGDIQSRSYEVLKKGGKLIAIVNPPLEEEARRYGVHASHVFVTPNGEQLRRIGTLLERGVVKPPVIEEMRLEEAAEAQRRSQAGHVRGKIVLKIR